VPGNHGIELVPGRDFRGTTRCTLISGCGFLRVQRVVTFLTGWLSDECAVAGLKVHQSRVAARGGHYLWQLLNKSSYCPAGVMRGEKLNCSLDYGKVFKSFVS